MPSTLESRAGLPPKEEEKAYETAIGRRIDCWETLSILGYGSDGVCFKVKKADGTEAALKLFRNKEEGGFETFLFERIMRPTNIEECGDSIVRLWGRGTAPFPEEKMEEVPYLLMELSEGRPWRHLEGNLKNEDPISFIGRVTCMALADQDGRLHGRVQPHGALLF